MARAIEARLSRPGRLSRADSAGPGRLEISAAQALVCTAPEPRQSAHRHTVGRAPRPGPKCPTHRHHSLASTRFPHGLDSEVRPLPPGRPTAPGSESAARRPCRLQLECKAVPGASESALPDSEPEPAPVPAGHQLSPSRHLPSQSESIPPSPPRPSESAASPTRRQPAPAPGRAAAASPPAAGGGGDGPVPPVRRAVGLWGHLCHRGGGSKCHVPPGSMSRLSSEHVTSLQRACHVPPTIVSRPSSEPVTSLDGKMTRLHPYMPSPHSHRK